LKTLHAVVVAARWMIVDTVSLSRFRRCIPAAAQATGLDVPIRPLLAKPLAQPLPLSPLRSPQAQRQHRRSPTVSHLHWVAVAVVDQLDQHRKAPYTPRTSPCR
jgi:hypothetical protein